MTATSASIAALPALQKAHKIYLSFCLSSPSLSLPLSSPSDDDDYDDDDDDHDDDEGDDDVDYDYDDVASKSISELQLVTYCLGFGTHTVQEKRGKSLAKASRIIGVVSD